MQGLAAPRPRGQGPVPSGRGREGGAEQGSRGVGVTRPGAVQLGPLPPVSIHSPSSSIPSLKAVMETRLWGTSAPGQEAQGCRLACYSDEKAQGPGRSCDFSRENDPRPEAAQMVSEFPSRAPEAS